MKKTKIKVTVYSLLKNDFISERTFYCNSRFLANNIIDEFAMKDNTVDIESEILK